LLLQRVPVPESVPLSRDATRFGFPGTRPVLGVSEGCPGIPAEFGSGCQMSLVFPSHKNSPFLTVNTNILTFPRLEKLSVGVGQPSTSE